MKKVILYIIFVLLAPPIFSQHESIGNKYLANDAIKYEIILVSEPRNKGLSGMKYLVKIEMPKRIKKWFQRRPKEYWQRYLHDSSSNIAANLILYYIYRRDAVMPKAVAEGLLTWNQVLAGEIDYWNSFLRE